MPASTDLIAKSHSPLLVIDADTFRNDFDRRPFLIEHHLVDHPLFDLPRLVELARRLPEDRIEYNAGEVPIHLDPKETPHTGLSVEETIRRIEECKSWLVLKNIEQDADYAQLLEKCLNEVGAHSEPMFPNMVKKEAFVFITSPGSVTPYHIDHEHNFLLQIRGSKQVHLFDGRDRTILTDQELENFYTGSHRNLTYREEVEEKARLFDLQPGYGLHFPVTHPHWVQNGADVSISFSITFATPDLDRHGCVHCFNATLRRCGIRPTPIEKSSWRDTLKYQTYRAWRRACRLIGK